MSRIKQPHQPDLGRSIRYNSSPLQRGPLNEGLLEFYLSKYLQFFPVWVFSHGFGQNSMVGGMEVKLKVIVLARALGKEMQWSSRRHFDMRWEQEFLRNAEKYISTFNVIILV